MKKNAAVIFFLLSIPVIALAQSSTPELYVGPVDMVGAALVASTKTITNNLQTIALKMFFSFLLLQTVIDGASQIYKGEMESAMTWVGKTFAWAGFCLWLLADSGKGDGLSHAGNLMRITIDYFLAKASEWVGANGGSFDTGDIIAIGLVAYGKITIAVVKATSTNVVNAAVAVALPGTNLITGLMIFFVSTVIFISCLYIALKVFMVKLNVSLMICAAPLSLSLLGLKGLRDQGFAPFKGLLALVYKIIVLAAIVSAIKVVADSLSITIDKLSFGIAADIFTPLLAAMSGFVLLAFITHHADSIASSLASGSSGLSTGDIASSIATGVAAGLTAGAGAAALANVGSKAIESLSNAKKDMDLSVSNASTTGSGRPSDQGPVGQPPERPADQSNASQSASGVSNSPPSRSPSGQSGATAGIGGQNGANDSGKKQQPDSSNSSNKFANRLKDLGRHMEQDKSATHVSINTHHHD